jgi:hypothetical protein
MILTGSGESQCQRVRFTIPLMTTGFFALPKKEERKEKEGGS